MNYKQTTRGATDRRERFAYFVLLCWGCWLVACGAEPAKPPVVLPTAVLPTATSPPSLPTPVPTATPVRDSAELLEAAMGYYLAGEYDAALAEHDALIALLESAADPGRLSLAYVLRAETQTKRREYEAAIDDLQAAVREGETRPLVWKNLCRLYALLEQPETGLPFCEQAALADEELAQDSMGLTLAMLGHLEGGAAGLRGFLDLNSSKVDPQLVDMCAERRVWIRLLGQGDNPFTPQLMAALRANDPVAGRLPDEAAQDMPLLQALNDYWLGRERAREGDYAAARAAFGAALAQMPDFDEALVARGSTAVLRGEPLAALPDLDAALALNPRNGNAWHWRGAVYWHAGLLDRAIQDLTRALELNPRTPATRDLRGLALLAKRDAASALRDFDVALLGDIKNGEIWLHRARADTALGRYGSALIDVLKAQELGLPPEQEREAAALLEELKLREAAGRADRRG